MIGSGEAAGPDRRVPLNEFIFKVQSRCNLNCSYCYVYNLADQSWRDQPASLDESVMRAAFARVAEHARAHELPSVLLSMHGGEPLLRGPEPIERFVELAAETIRGIELHFSLQTNATLVSDDVARRLAQLDVGVGVSLDGDLGANDRFRLDIHGQSSFAAALSGIEALALTGALRGLLCVIDLRNDPRTTWEFLAGLGAPSIDFLLPHATWADPIRGKEFARVGDLGADAPYGRWLADVYDQWSAAPDPPVRILADIVHLLLGGEHTYEAVGLGPSTLVTVEADGSIELVDHLKSAFAGATATGLNVFEHSFDQMLEHPGVAIRQSGLAGLHADCRRCPRVRVCGGGLITHRWHPELGFEAPTLYCSDMDHLIAHIEGDLARRIERSAQALSVNNAGG